MSDEFGTVNVKRGDRAREIEVLRDQYSQHRETLVQLAEDAPTEHLGSEYSRLIREIDVAMGKLDELEGGGPQAGPDVSRSRTTPGDRPLVSPPAAAVPFGDPEQFGGSSPNPSSRTVLIIIVGIVVVGLISWLIWRGSNDRKPPVVAADQPVTTTLTETSTPVTPLPAAAPLLKVVPELADFGTVRKGTRAVRQFEVTNTGSTPLSIQVSRSACRCLYYDYDGKGKVPAKGKETITVAIDGARAKSGPLRETLQITSKGDPTATAQMEVSATIQ